MFFVKLSFVLKFEPCCHHTQTLRKIWKAIQCHQIQAMTQIVQKMKQAAGLFVFVCCMDIYDIVKKYI